MAGWLRRFSEGRYSIRRGWLWGSGADRPQVGPRICGTDDCHSVKHARGGCGADLSPPRRLFRFANLSMPLTLFSAQCASVPIERMFVYRHEVKRSPVGARRVPSPDGAPSAPVPTPRQLWVMRQHSADS